MPEHVSAAGSQTRSRRILVAPFLAGALIGTLGGLVGLGGAEFRLPLLIAVFGFVALEAVILNKAISLVVVASAFIFRTRVIALDTVLTHWPVLLNILAGSLVGAWVGADFATRLNARTLYRTIAVLLLAIAALLAFEHNPTAPVGPAASGATLIALGIGAGLVIGAIAALLGVAGGEFLIPTLVLLFGLDIKLAGSLSLAISLPTMLMGFARYSRDRSFHVLKSNPRFVLTMASGSIVGTFIGSRLLAIVPAAVLPPILAAILVLSALKIWRHRWPGRPSNM